MAEENPLPGEPEEKDIQERRSASDAAPGAPNAAEGSPLPKDPADPLFRLFASSQESGAARWESKAFEPLPEPTSRILPDAPVRAAQEHAEKASENKTQSQPSEPDFTPEPIVPERLSKTLEMAAIPAPPPAPTPASTPASQRPEEQPLPTSAEGVPAPDLHEEPAQHTKLAPVDAAFQPVGPSGAGAGAIGAEAVPSGPPGPPQADAEPGGSTGNS